MSGKKFEVYVNDELWTFNVSNAEFEAATTGRLICHNKIWVDIASEMNKATYNVTAIQCQNKMSGLKRTYKNISDSNNQVIMQVFGPFTLVWIQYLGKKPG
ncbi:uncharacterized protein LOC105183233 [Harpegnathos saltator]|uniref:uncharacterized protein LOC105183233 n=1 Tax=Harpegnathos saltator TaxID=610380 RepID=UPI000DBEE565|nr:uncharacterized protein LOC105183233 [Harpegnathos saltator]